MVVGLNSSHLTLSIKSFQLAMNSSVVKWLLCPIAITHLLVFLSIFYGYLKPNDYADTLFLATTAIFNIYPGIVHAYKADTGLVSIAQMNQKSFEKHKNALIMLHPLCGNLQIGRGVLYLYFIYFRQDVVMEINIFVILNAVYKIIYGASVRKKELQTAFDALIPHAPGRQYIMASGLLFTIYMFAKFLL
eukprot:301203_1